MIRKILKIAAVLAGLLLVAAAGLFVTGNHTPPPEVLVAGNLEKLLWSERANHYFPSEYRAYQRSLRGVKDDYIREAGRFIIFRDFDFVAVEYRQLLRDGFHTLHKVTEYKRIKGGGVEDELNALARRLDTVDELSSIINEGRLSRRTLTRARLLLDEAQSLHRRGEYERASQLLAGIRVYASASENVMLPILSRFSDPASLGRWQRWVSETIADSRRQGTKAIVVSKVDRTLTLYAGGRPVQTVDVGLGRNGSMDKLRSGDGATPEGRYYIVKKMPRSHYYKALLINYPNDEDFQQFSAAKRKGLISSRASIGGLVEIHGGGPANMTYGCISVANRHMDELFDSVEVGTPVTIVGATDGNNSVAAALKGL